MRSPSERLIVFLIGAVQFINILDFVIVMPIGPDTAKALAFPEPELGWVSFAYAGAAAVAGVIGSTFLDRFDRRKALAVAMVGLVLGTAAGGLAVDLETLMLARVIAGLFGGPATSLAFAIIADVVPLERRGRATGALMGALAVATVFGVPAGLWIGLHASWRVTYFSVAALGVLITAAVTWGLPPLTVHLTRARVDTPILTLLGRTDVQLSYSMTALVMLSGFILIPNIPSYVLMNLRYPREDLGLLYSVGGAASFLATRFGGRLVDRWGSFRVSTAGVALLLSVLVPVFVFGRVLVPLPLVYVTFMTALGLRNVAYNTLTSKVPAPEERARFSSLQSTVQHLASGLGALIAAELLDKAPTGELVHMDRVALVAIVLSLGVPGMVSVVERRVRRRLEPGDLR